MAIKLLKFRTLYQLGFSILIVAALVIQFVHGVIVEHGITLAFLGLFFSYFTILSNILVAVVLCFEAKRSLQGKPLSPRFERIRSAAVFCILTTGLIYTLFLRGPGGPGNPGMQGMVPDSIPWINAVFHYIMPWVMLGDWLLFPPKKPTHWHSILAWILLTATYLVYVELLGLFTNSYPYFFLDPTTFHGYAGVLRASIAFIPFFAVFGVALVVLNRIRLKFTWKQKRA